MKSRLVVYIFLFLIALFVRIPNSWRLPVNDESMAIRIAGEMPVEVVKQTYRDIAHPALFYISLSIWGKVSQNIFWLRLFTVILGASSSLVIFFLFSHIFNRQIGLLAYLFSSVSPQLVFVSQYLRPYIMGVFLTSLSIIPLIRHIECIGSGNLKKNKLYLTLYFIFALLSLYTFYYSGLIIFSVFLWYIFIFRPAKKEYFNWIGGHALLTLAFLPQLAILRSQIANIDAFRQSAFPLISKVKMGFYLGDIHIGAIVKAVLSIFQLDDVIASLRYSTRFPIILFLFFAVVFLVIFIFFIVSGFKYLRKIEKLKGVTYLIVFLIFVPLLVVLFQAILGDLGVGEKVPINPKYFVQSSIFFSSFIAATVFSIRRKLFRTVLLIVLFSFFLYRTIDVLAFSKYKLENDVVEFISQGADSYITVVTIPREPVLLKDALNKMGDREKIRYFVINSKDDILDVIDQIKEAKGFYFYFRPSARNVIQFSALKSGFEVEAKNNHFAKKTEKNFRDAVYIALYGRNTNGQNEPKKD